MEVLNKFVNSLVCKKIIPMIFSLEIAFVNLWSWEISVNSIKKMKVNFFWKLSPRNCFNMKYLPKLVAKTLNVSASCQNVLVATIATIFFAIASKTRKKKIPWPRVMFIIRILRSDKANIIPLDWNHNNFS